MMIHRRSRPTVEERSKKATPNAVGVAHYAPLGAAGIMALIGPFCKPHVQRGVMIALFWNRESAGAGDIRTGNRQLVFVVQSAIPQLPARSFAAFRPADPH